ncbi:MAG: type II secretion system protein [Lentisphaeria bacterium]|nr:type II secretion system GspH family protein [Lentisphaeria bacterium]NQZ66589.1 type II secretion system protein [Lentisphaeria bacterium]
MKLYFTLIELLVLVTIISILGSLLLPVMGGAKYQSKLTQCIGNEHQLGVAISRYSSDFNEFLPRLSVNVEGGCRPAIKYNGVDDRPLLQSYMSLNDVLVCPLTRKIDLAGSSSNNVYSSYELWFGSTVLAYESEGMMKITDTLGWNGNQFKVMASSLDAWHPAYWQSSHPDRNVGLLTPRRLNSTGILQSLWMNGNDPARGNIDRNFLFTDGSVEQILNVKMLDTRLKPIPYFSNSTTARLCYLPAQ